MVSYILITGHSILLFMNPLNFKFLQVHAVLFYTNRRSVSLLLFWKCFLLICLPLWTLPTFFKLKNVKKLENRKTLKRKKRDQNKKNVKNVFLHLSKTGSVHWRHPANMIEPCAAVMRLYWPWVMYIICNTPCSIFPVTCTNISEKSTSFQSLHTFMHRKATIIISFFCNASSRKTLT